VEPVKATLGKETAWTGEAVPLIITLYSPGPFSGAAAFDLPDLPLTAVIRGGSPVVGSESIDDESYFTQRHELAIYTQRNGEIVIPPFRVRFAGKKTFTSPAEPMEGVTAELSFESKRPPGTDKLGVVVAATKMETTQTWTPENPIALNAGDVVQRTIVRRASGTTAMMLAPILGIAPDGVRVYVGDPEVQDRNVRGTATAERSDTIKYQFERAGTFTIPDSKIVWWDAAVSELRQETLEGKTISVDGSATAIADQEDLETGSAAYWVFFAVAMSVGVVGGIAWKLTRWIYVRRNEPEPLAARRLLSACHANEAADAYAAFLNWKRIVTARGSGPQLERLMCDDCVELGCEVERLARQLFAERHAAEAWSGKSLAGMFARTRNMLLRKDGGFHASSSLPTLNPSTVSELLGN
jgi:hypothetical protein